MPGIVKQALSFLGGAAAAAAVVSTTMSVLGAASRGGEILEKVEKHDKAIEALPAQFDKFNDRLDSVNIQLGHIREEQGSIHERVKEISRRLR